MRQVTYRTVRRDAGRHDSPEEGACVMELASRLAGEPLTERPHTVSPKAALAPYEQRESAQTVRSPSERRATYRTCVIRMTFRGRGSRLRNGKRVSDVCPPNQFRSVAPIGRGGYGRAAENLPSVCGAAARAAPCAERWCAPMTLVA
jgi:hypothetical protein